jgi:hypothetical protein
MDADTLAPEVAEALATLRLAEEVRGYTSHTDAEWRAIDQAPEALALIIRELERGARVEEVLMLNDPRFTKVAVFWRRDDGRQLYTELLREALAPQEEER